MHATDTKDENANLFRKNNADLLALAKVSPLPRQACAYFRSRLGVKSAQDAYNLQVQKIDEIKSKLQAIDSEVNKNNLFIANSPASIAFGSITENLLLEAKNSLETNLAEREKLKQSLDLNNQVLPHLERIITFTNQFKRDMELTVYDSIIARSMDAIRTKAGDDLVLLVNAICGKDWIKRESWESVFIRIIKPLFPNPSDDSGAKIPVYREGFAAITAFLNDSAMSATALKSTQRKDDKNVSILENPVFEKHPYPRYVAMGRDENGRMLMVIWDVIVNYEDEPDRKKHCDWDVFFCVDLTASDSTGQPDHNKDVFFDAA